MDRVHVATLNIRNLADRWPERLPLLLADMAALQPDVMGLQEVTYPAQQDRLIAAAGEARYECLRGWAGRPEYGNTILVRAPLTPTETERIDLGRDRCALRAVVALPRGSRLLFVVTHLHHLTADETVRDEQVARLIAWLAAATTDGVVIVGDFNAEPDEPAYERMNRAGYRSAYFEANGHEPAVTWPSGIQAPAPDTEGPGGCLDYIWLRSDVRVGDARLVFDRPAVEDPGLFPSDHFGLAAHLEVGAGRRENEV
jgi:endonuclease/exonuclease/phosphatase family metal-dependent hydrolase